MKHRLLDHIEDDEMRRNLEEAVVEQLSETDTTILTNAYLEKELQKYILQLSTYQDGELYGSEIVVPDEETYEEYQMDFFRLELEDIVRAIDEALEAE